MGVQKAVVKVEVCGKHYKDRLSGYYKIPCTFTLEDGSEVVIPVSGQRLKDAKSHVERYSFPGGCVGKYVEQDGPMIIQHYKHSEYIEWVKANG